MRWAIEYKGYSQRRACGLVGLAAKTYRYRSRRPEDGELRQKLRELAAERRRFGHPSPLPTGPPWTTTKTASGYDRRSTAVGNADGIRLLRQGDRERAAEV